jgi:hypothetical protein
MKRFYMGPRALPDPGIKVGWLGMSHKAFLFAEVRAFIASGKGMNAYAEVNVPLYKRDQPYVMTTMAEEHRPPEEVKERVFHKCMKCGGTIECKAANLRECTFLCGKQMTMERTPKGKIVLVHICCDKCKKPKEEKEYRTWFRGDGTVDLTCHYCRRPVPQKT